MNRNNIIWWSVFTIFIIGFITFAIIFGQKQIEQNGINNTETERSESEILAKRIGDNETNKDAPITIIEYSDFQCPACASYNPILKEIIKEYEGQINLIYRHFPLRSIHPNAQIAAQAAEAAGVQGKFYEMHDSLFNNQNDWAKKPNPRADFYKYAEQIGIDVTKFKSDLNSEQVRNKVNQNYSEAMNDLGLRSTPTIFIDGQIMPSGISGSTLKEVINQIIKENTNNKTLEFDSESLTNIEQ